MLVDSLGQGFLVFGSDGVCGPAFSRACQDLFEVIPAGLPVADVLRVAEDQRPDFNDWIHVLFRPEHALSFEDVVKFLPSTLRDTEGRHIALVYRPIHDLGDFLEGVVVIATDQTAHVEAQKTLEKQQVFAVMVRRIFDDRNGFAATVAHLRALAIASPRVTREERTEFLRHLHTIKANARYFSILDVETVVHNLETSLRGLEDEGDGFNAALVGGQEALTQALACLTVTCGNLLGREGEGERLMLEMREDDVYAFGRVLRDHRVPPDLLREYLLTLAAVPFNACFKSFERSLQDLAGILDKQVKPVRFIGSNPLILTRPLREFLFALPHLARNMADHGLEDPVTRLSRGKDPQGQVTICGDVVVGPRGEETLEIRISDDGNGIDPSRVRARLAVVDPQGEWRFEDDKTVIQRVFSWGFSTKGEVSRLSGRGLGLDVMAHEVGRLGGSMSVASELYRGVEFIIRVPYRMDERVLKDTADG